MNIWVVRVLATAVAATTLLLGYVPLAFAGAGGPVTDSCGQFQGSNRNFSLINLNANPAPIAVSDSFGPSGASPNLDPIPADYTNNGVSSFGVYRHETGEFFLKDDLNGGDADLVVTLGAANRQPPASPLIGIAGQFDGNGAGIGVYDPDASTFTLMYPPLVDGKISATFKLGNGLAASPNGQRLIPFVGDFDNDDVDTVGVYSPRDGTFTFINTNADGAAQTTIRFGGKGTSNVPFAGDFDGDGTDTIGFKATGQNTFYQASANVKGGGTVNEFKFGGKDTSIVPVCGNWDGL